MRLLPSSRRLGMHLLLVLRGPQGVHRSVLGPDNVGAPELAALLRHLRQGVDAMTALHCQPLAPHRHEKLEPSRLPLQVPAPGELFRALRVHCNGRPDCHATGRQPMTPDTGDLALVQRVQKGDKSAFDLLVRKYQHKVLKLVSRYLRDPADAEDVAQEAFIKAYRALPQFRGDSAFYTWLYRIAINTAKNALLSRDRNPVEFDLDLQNVEESSAMQGRLADPETPESLLATEEIRETVNRAIEALPEDLRTAIVLRELEGLSYEDIAAAMDCPVGTVRSRIFRAREAIDRKLSDVFEGGLGRAEESG